MGEQLIRERDERVEAICRELRALVRESGLTQRQIEEANGFTARYLSQVLKGHIVLTVRHLVGILAALDVSLPEFFARVGGRVEDDLTAGELRQRLDRYDAAFAELARRGLLEPDER